MEISFGNINSGIQVGINHGTIHISPERPDTPPQNSVFTVPFQRDGDFVVNQQQLDEVTERLSASRAPIALIGCGGAGKTHLAIEYIYRIRHLSPTTLILWIYASNAARLDQCYRDIADQFNIPHRNDPDTNIFQIVHDRLEAEEEKWIMVLDGMDNDDFDFFKISPPGNLEGGLKDNSSRQFKSSRISTPQSVNGSIVVTTRNMTVAKMIAPDDNIIEIGPMEEPLAMVLFQWKLRGPAREEDIRSIVQLLFFHPLSIIQAAAFIKSSGFGILLFHKDLTTFVSTADQALIPSTIRGTLHIVLGHIRETRPTAWNLLCLMSLLDRQEFSQDLLRTLSEMRSNISGTGTNVFINAHFHNDRFDIDITTLIDFGLINIRQDTQALGISSLVQNEIRDWLEHHGKIDHWRTQFIKYLSLVFPTDLESRRKCRSLFPHVKAAMTIRPNQLLQGSLLEWATLLHGGARYAGKIGESGDMEHMALEAWRVKNELLGPDDLETIEVSMTLTLAFLLQGRWKEAESLAEKQVEKCSRELGAEHPTSLSATGYLALAKWYQGQWKEAEVPSLKLLEMARQTFGLEHPDTLTIMSNIATIYESQGRWREAEEINSEVLEIRTRALGPEHPSTLTSMNNLAVIYENQGRLVEAEEINSKVLQVRMRVLAAEHPDTLATMTNLASVCYAQGQFGKAEELYIKVLGSYKSIRGLEHRDTLIAMDNLGAIYREQGRWDEAETLQAQVLHGRQKILGTEHPDTWKSLVNFAEIHWHQGRREDAEAIQKQAIDIQKRNLGPNHPDVLSSVDFLGLIYRSRGQLLDAEAIHREVIDLRLGFLGPMHPSTLDSKAKLSLVLLDQGRPDEAESLQTEVIEKQREVYGSDHPAVFSSLNTLARIYRNQRRLPEAKNTLGQVIDYRQRIFGPEHLDTLDSMEGLAFVLFELDQWKEAEALARKVKLTRRKLLRENHPDTIKLVQLLDQISEMKLANGIYDVEGEDSSISDFGSIASGLSLVGSLSSATTLDNATFSSAVDFFTTLLLKIDSFQHLCKFALESDKSKVHIQRNLSKLLRQFAYHLSRETELANHTKVIRFVRQASSRIASHIILSFGISNPSGLEESNIRQVEKASSRAKILEYLGGQDIAKPASSEGLPKSNSDEDIPMEAERHEQVDFDSDSDADSIQDALEVQQPTTVDDLQRIEALIFKTNAFQIIERRFFDYLFPSLRSVLMRWISEQRRAGSLTNKQLRDLEAVVSELQHIAHDQISFTLHDPPSIINRIKGKWENFTTETWDWWPLSPYMRPLSKGEARLHWQCQGCGRARWAEVPVSFAKQITSASATITRTNTASKPPGIPTSGPASAQPGFSVSQPQRGSHNPSPCQPNAVPQFASLRPRPEGENNLHIFLVVTHSSLFRKSKRLAQTSVTNMNDEQFFSWVRTSYYHHRGFFPSWFGVHRYSHCEFFKFEKYKKTHENGYTPLAPEFPTPQQLSYHFYPKPISPEPPITPHEFNDWFLDHVWYITVLQRITKRILRSKSSNAGSEYVVVDERLPKRDTHLDEGDSSREIFWGLYVVERRSTSMLVLYSFIFLIPSFYFFFAWLFEWHHSGDLQNASVPLTLAFSSLGAFWVIISLKSPSFEGHLKVD